MSPLTREIETLATPTFCRCRCHRATTANRRAIEQGTRYGRFAIGVALVSASDLVSDGFAYRANPLDAATACPSCLDLHCLALLNDIPELRERRVRQAFEEARQRLATDTVAEAVELANQRDEQRDGWVDPPVTDDPEPESDQG